jgi:hypothetical protein
VPALTYSDAAHRYRLDGRYVPNVTTILNAGLPKPALTKWAAKTVATHVADHVGDVATWRTMGREPLIEALAAIPDERRNTAAARGTAVHDLAEQVVHGLAVDVPPDIADRVRGYADFLDQYDVQPVATEVMVANRTSWYAGRLDLIADLFGTRWLLDLKTSSGVYGDTSLQLAAYAAAEFYQDANGDEVDMPSVERLGVVHITDQGTDLYDMGRWPDPDAWLEFLACKTLHAGGSRRRRLDGYQRDPLAPRDVDARLSFGGIA